VKKYFKLIFCLSLAILFTPMYTATAKAAQLVIDVYTSTTIGSGTDANVQIRINGNNGRSVVYTLDNGENNFEIAKHDIFTINNVIENLGDIISIEIKRDDSGFAPDWQVDAVGVEYISSNGNSVIGSNFHKWIPANTWVKGS